jgi:hypothetical protein
MYSRDQIAAAHAAIALNADNSAVCCGPATTMARENRTKSEGIAPSIHADKESMVSTSLHAPAGSRLGLSGAAMAVVILLIGTGRAAADAQQVRIELAAPAPETVWRHADEGAPCAPSDYADVPVRPFLVKGAAPGTYRVLWFAANSQGYFASETPGPDLAPADVTLAHFRRLPGCVRWVRSQPYVGSTPERYNTGLWMVAPFTHDGTSVYALVHNEFHGEWTGSRRWCEQHRRQIYLPCNYWNLVSASSADGGRHLALRQLRPDWNVPAIALAAPYPRTRSDRIRSLRG